LEQVPGEALRPARNGINRKRQIAEAQKQKRRLPEGRRRFV
jgi:hypothetical protein